MLEYEKIDISDGIDVSKSDNQKNVCSVAIGIL